MQPVRLKQQYNWGWVTVTAVWKAGDEIELWVNGDFKEEKDTDVSHCPSNQCYIGENPAINPGESFRGGIGEVRLYSGLQRTSKEEISEEILKIISYCLGAYEFKDFEKVILKDLSSGAQTSISRLSLLEEFKQF